ncbi:MAG TPA: PE-PPE domain-containing protein [Mycobacterium sp.]|nr:PE-PPE domain-containing protein [Mycobacterium sp.]
MGPLNGRRVATHVAAVGVIAGAVSAPITGLVHADLKLLAAEGPLAGSETALILGGTTEPTPSPEFARTAEDLFLHPLGFDGGATDSLVCTMNGTDPCSAPLQVLTTPELVQQGPSSLTGASNVVLAVENEFAANPGAFSAEHPLTIFGYSQSATAESIAMTHLAAAGIPSNDLHFVFIGDPSAPVTGVWPNLEADMEATIGPSLTNYLLTTFDMNQVLGNVTPNDLYPATIYSYDPDPVPNFQQSFEANGLWGALLNIFYPHVEYLGLTPEEVANATTTVDGDLTFQHITDVGVNQPEAWLNAVFVGGAANSGLLQSVSDSIGLLFNNAY